ncbi:FAD-binding domain-containing protein, partial [Bimuria novae-zelandiae CBS 107.79]
EECRYTPEDDEWPSDAEWAFFNETLGGVLLKPQPLAISCYAGPSYDTARCASLQTNWRSMAQHNPNSVCTQGGFPVYVVNAMTVRHVQMAVNFARNKNLRLVIKNSGHNYNGNNIGGNALSVWVYNLKGLTYYDNYQASDYTGRAVALAGGTTATEVNAASRTYSMTILNAGGPDVTIPGGYFQGAGHSTYANFYGLAADHVLQISAVTADGIFVVADARANSDLFWAFRGGGGGTLTGNFGVLTSIVVRTFPVTPVASSSISWSTISQPGTPGVSNESFWAGIREYLSFSTSLCDNKGFGYNFLRHTSSSGANGLTFTSSLSLPNRTAAELRAFIRSFLERLNDVRIPISTTAMLTLDFPNMPSSPQISRRALGDTVGNTLIASRLFQRSNYASASSIRAAHRNPFHRQRRRLRRPRPSHESHARQHRKPRQCNHTRFPNSNHAYASV